MATTVAPEWQTSAWLNTPEPITLASLRGRVVLVHAFQMLCPGCVAHGIPQVQRVAKSFPGLQVIGMHTVFEHHDVMNVEALRAFVHEYRVTFPVGVDAPGPEGDSMPRTMRAYAMQGTPTTLLFDASGNLRRKSFGVHDDLLLGADIGRLLAEAEREGVRDAGTGNAPGSGCTEEGCAAD